MRAYMIVAAAAAIVGCSSEGEDDAGGGQAGGLCGAEIEHLGEVAVGVDGPARDEVVDVEEDGYSIDDVPGLLKLVAQGGLGAREDFDARSKRGHLGEERFGRVGSRL